MKTHKKILTIFPLIFVIVVNGCTQSPALSAAPESPANTQALPTPVPLAHSSLQLDNNLPFIPLEPRHSQELLDNRVGVHFEHYDRYSDTEHVYANGFKWIRIQSLTEFWGDGYDLKTFNLTAIPVEVDNIISGYADSGVNIVLDLWMGAGLRPYGTTFQSEEEITRYLDYVRFVVSHFRNRIQNYQIWNEPGDVAVSDYATLVKRVVPVIRETDPDARIIIPGVQGNWENDFPGYEEYQRFSVDIDYLNELLQSGVAHIVDGISWHPFYGNKPSDPYYQNYPLLLQGIKDLAESEGFTGEFFADEILWATVTEEDWDGGPPLSPMIAAKYYTRAIAMHRGLDVNVTINTFFQESMLWPIHNLCDILAGAEATDLSVSVASGDENVMHYTFALPNGDQLIALWINGEAVEDDPGVNTTLTIDNISTQGIIGVDVLNSFEQELIFEKVNNKTVIQNLLVKDYPIILRLVN